MNVKGYNSVLLENGSLGENRDQISTINPQSESKDNIVRTIL